MRRRRLLLLTLLPIAAACSSTEPTGPNAPRAAAVRDWSGGDYHDGRLVPGSRGAASSTETTPQGRHYLACRIDAPITGTADIGPRGGVLAIGNSTLIVPPGALTETHTLTATVDAGDKFVIHFEPTGLQFKKPAGLVLDASACADAPDVLYLDETTGDVLEEIRAVFSNWWHLIAAPLDHFSSYALAV